MNEETIHNLITFEDTLAQYISDENVQKCVAFSQNNIKYYNGKEKIDIEKRKENIGKIYFFMEDTLSAVEKFMPSKIAVLDFASATTPGGGVLIGSKGQEEDLCRKTTLYFNLNSDKLRKEYYQKNKTDTNLIQKADCIYIPEICILKEYKEKEQRYLSSTSRKIDIVVCAAPNLRKQTMNISSDKLSQYHMERADSIFKSAIDNNVETLILGAFGCGAFRNPPELVAEVYKIASLKYRKYFKNIVFSVRDKGELDYNKVVFQQMVLKIGGTVIDGI